MSKTFDFIVVGGGTAGCLLANRLTSAKIQPSVLLIEKGADPDVDHRMPYARFSNVFTRPDLDHAYVTTPLAALGNKVLPYARGKGLGGCSMINFMMYTRGAADDYNYWSSLTDSQDWSWDKVKSRFKKIERYLDKVPEDLTAYANPEPDAYGTEGILDISIPFEEDTTMMLDAAYEFGYQKNLNANDGNPVGLSVAAATSCGGMRTTSASAHIVPGTPNLTVKTQAQVTKILFDGVKAIGVQIDGTTNIYAAKEVILCAGAFDSPKLLLLSGVGPAQELEALNIEVVHNLPGVGKNLQDHCGVFTSDLVTDDITSRTAHISSEEEMETARQQWKQDRTGPLATYYNSTCNLFHKHAPLYETEEFKSLDESVQNYIRSPTVPSFEIAFNGPPFPPGFVFEDPKTSCFTMAVVLLNTQSRGSVTLKSSNPSDPPMVDVGYLTHPYDKKALIAAVRESRRLIKSSSLGKFWKGIICAPIDESDEAIWAYIQELISPIWHASSTITMGKQDDPSTCVNADMKVCGLENIRVADMSVCPLTISGHTQAVAYLIAQTAAEKIIEEYELN